MAEGDRRSRNLKRKLEDGFICGACEHNASTTNNYIPQRFKSLHALRRHVYTKHDKEYIYKCGISGCVAVFHARRLLYDHLKKEHNNAEWYPVFIDPHLRACEDHHDDGPTTADTHSQQLLSAERSKYGYSGMESAPAAIETTEIAGAENCLQYAASIPHESAIGDGDSNSDSNQVDYGTQADAGPSLESQENCTVDASSTSLRLDDCICDLHSSIKLSKRQKDIKFALEIAEIKHECNLTERSLNVIKAWGERYSQYRLCDFLISKEVPATESEKHLAKQSFQPLSGFQSSWMFKKLLRGCTPYVEPITVQLLKECHKSSMQYVPIIKTLEALFADREFKLQVISENQSQNSSQLWCNFKDGEYFKQHPLFSQNKNAIMLQIYYDDFQVCNALGTKTKNNLIGIMYFSIMNLPVRHRSTLKNIYLLSVFKQQDCKEFGWDAILEPFNSDLKKLEEEGLIINISGEDVQLKGTIAQISADNKAAHAMLGLQEKFYGRNQCISRYCYCTSTGIKDACSITNCKVRTIQSYAEDQDQLDSTGQPVNSVKSACPLKSSYFHRGQAYAPDIHHDVLEGLIPFMLKKLLQALATGANQLFTIDVLNERIEKFEYGYHDRRNKPTPIAAYKLNASGNSLKQYASQCWCLLRKMPLLVGDLVPRDNQYWHVLLQLIDVVDMIMAPAFDEDMIDCLDLDLRVLFSDFKRKFPDVNFTPKCHYVLHYPRLIREIGPLIHHWVMRFEGKHHVFKHLVVRSRNYKNVPKMMAVRHQQALAITINSNELLNVDYCIKGGYSQNVNTLEFGDAIKVLLKCTNVTVCKSLRVYGTMYKLNAFICCVGDEALQIGCIQSILVNLQHNVCFVVDLYDVIEYDEHFHSWKISKPDEPLQAVWLQSSLLDHQIVGVHRISSMDNDCILYANLKHYVSVS